jgi:hypothetical protein
MGITRGLRLGVVAVAGAAALSLGAAAPALAAGGANAGCGNYCANGNGIDPSQNGSNNGNATGRPAAGTVGNADNKNPPGQYPDGQDANNGYECDGNNGIAKTNPAHTGCTEGS